MYVICKYVCNIKKRIQKINQNSQFADEQGGGKAFGINRPIHHCDQGHQGRCAENPCAGLQRKLCPNAWCGQRIAATSRIYCRGFKYLQSASRWRTHLLRNAEKRVISIGVCCKWLEYDFQLAEHWILLFSVLVWKLGHQVQLWKWRCCCCGLRWALFASRLLRRLYLRPEQDYRNSNWSFRWRWSHGFSPFGCRR